MDRSDGKYGGRSADERRRDRRRRLLDAAFDIAGSQGFSALGVRVVCVQAGLNDRYFYESFTDCDQLLLAVYEDQAAALIARLMEVLDNTADWELRARIRSVIDVAIDFGAEDPRRGRLLEDAQSRPALRARRSELATLLAQMALAQGREVLGEDITTDPNYQMAALTVVNGLIELGATWWRGDLDATRDQIAEFMVAMILTSADIGSRLGRALSDANQ